eukprot:CAMPEP_0172564522 /NCGR_PEP_ID=MMETSP1067-20121228/104709_1 /TAXON_ID=265564 ORGANISM="Thalassiosira punctigera, Strain Tpunct2005C2" /NCGR_SAMPLE_ID=MMETSP1067 /ASSEMBLY_ACC=CAM_ASM_000444 /LENGTH=409 /DNA_ID=CAMNT_0013355213 /DNA_START=1 /DNA_END=1227 /DNA_ORIENTATION=+
MVLHRSEPLDERSEGFWTDVTESTIHDEAAAEVNIDPELVEVRVVLENQQALEPTRMLQGSRDDAGAPGPSRYAESSSPLRIRFATTIRFPSVTDDWDAEQMVASGFQSPAQRRNYINSLQERGGGSYFESLKSMTMEVGEDSDREGGSPPDEDGSANGAEGSRDIGGAVGGGAAGAVGGAVGGNNAAYYIVGGSVGGACILLFATAIVIYCFTRGKGGTSDRDAKGQSFPTAGTSSDRYPPVVEIGTEVATKDETLHQPTPTSYIGTIESKEEVDDVSTLGDPYMGDAVNAVMDTDRTVGESMVSSQQELYVYGVGRPTCAATLAGGSTINGSTINSGSYVRRHMIFGEDATLEAMYRPPDSASSAMMGEDQSQQFQTVTVVAPSGKLGIVLDNPQGDLPIVWAIKET